MPETEKLVVEAPPLNVWSADQEFASERSEDGVARQLPPTAKQPVERLMPPPVEVNVDVPLATKFPTPCTERSEPGVEVPMPMLPLDTVDPVPLSPVP